MKNIKQILAHVKKQGGATLNLDETFFTPKQGYMISLLGYESKVSLDDKDAIEERLTRYKDIIRDILKNTALDVKIGLWLEDGVLYLDISQYTKDKELALYLGKARAQLAIFDFANNEAINLTLTPFITL